MAEKKSKRRSRPRAVQTGSEETKRSIAASVHKIIEVWRAATFDDFYQCETSVAEILLDFRRSSKLKESGMRISMVVLTLSVLDGLTQDGDPTSLLSELLRQYLDGEDRGATQVLSLRYPKEHAEYLHRLRTAVKREYELACGGVLLPDWSPEDVVFADDGAQVGSLS